MSALTTSIKHQTGVLNQFYTARKRSNMHVGKEDRKLSSYVYDLTVYLQHPKYSPPTKRCQNQEMNSAMLYDTGEHTKISCISKYQPHTIGNLN